jgi:hypothetical protein
MRLFGEKTETRTSNMKRGKKMAISEQTIADNRFEEEIRFARIFHESFSKLGFSDSTTPNLGLPGVTSGSMNGFFQWLSLLYK